MTLEEKIASMEKLVLTEADQKREATIEEYKKSLQEMLDDHKETLKAKNDSLVEVETQQLEQEKNRLMAGEHLDYRRKLSEKTDELKQALFADITKKLNEYMKTESYDACLEKQIKETVAFARGEEMVIYINPTDAGKKAALEAACGVKLTVSDQDFIGGTRAVISERNILIDRSFQTKLEEEKDSFGL